MNEGNIRQWSSTDPEIARRNWEDQMESLIAQTFTKIEELEKDMDRKVAQGVVTGVKQLVADEEFMRAFSEKASQRFLIHSGDQATRWLGNRILTVFVIAAVGWAVGWLVKNGKI